MEGEETSMNAPFPEPLSSSTPLSLFPVSDDAGAVSGAGDSGWLRNSSFTVDLSVVNDAVSAHHNLETVNDEKEDDEDYIDRREKERKRTSTSYELLESSGSDRERRDYSDKKKKRKKSTKRLRREREAGDIGDGFYGFGSRKTGVHVWDSSGAKPSKDYYFDARGDPDNLAFGSLYRMDVVQYKPHNAVKSSYKDIHMYSQVSNRGFLSRGELDVDVLDSKLKSTGRYWSAKYSAIERQKNFKRVRIVAPEKKVPAPYDDFISLMDEDEYVDSFPKASVIEESWEDEVLRKTREFNKMTREQPYNVKTWLEFAEFQDRVASRQPQKGARLQTLEKKISILEKATELNPEDEDLLLYLLKTYQERDTYDVAVVRWEKALMRNPGSYKLWREFLRVIQSGFTMFKVSELRKMYGHAIQALSAVSSQKKRQLHSTLESLSPNAEDIELELRLVDLFLSLCRFEWQAGYRELATALFQAEMEYSLFSPPLQLTELSKKRLFEHFWNSNGARVGEDGALGWSTWLEKEEENRQKLLQEMSSKEEEQGGWTRWFVPPDKATENLSNVDEAVTNDLVLEEMEEEKEAEDAKQEEDDEVLLRMLGIDIDAEANREVLESITWLKWSEEELARDSNQWMPIRAKSEKTHNNEGIQDEEEQLSRVILFEDVTDYLFSLSSTEARLSLVLQFVDFFGGEVTPSICTNSSSWTEKILSLEILPESILKYLRRVDGAFNKVESGPIIQSLEYLLHCPDNPARKEIMKFLRNASLLCLRVFPRNYKIEEAILIAEEESYARSNSLQCKTMPSQALAKRLLKSDRQDVLLCGVYARREAAFGNIDHARKVFDMALSSVNGLCLETQLTAAPILTLWYSEMELADGFFIESESTLRALHILSCLGSGVPYTQYKGRPSSMQLLKAHQGFKERISKLRSSWQKHVIDESSIALIYSAALFEELTSGWVAGAKILSDALSMVLPEKKGRSYELELLFNFYVRMLQRHHHETKLSKLMQSLTGGLQTYPCNLDLFASLVELCHLYMVPHDLRRIFDEVSQKKQSAFVWLVALSYELSRGGSSHRIHGLFERALANEMLRSCVVLWRSYIAYEINTGNPSGARRIFFRAIHACPWSKMLWLDGFQKLSNVLSAKELMDLQEVMRDKELNLRTDVYEILLQDEINQS